MHLQPIPQAFANAAKDLLDYDPETGLLTWRTRPVEMFKSGVGRSALNVCAVWNSRHAGKIAGSKENDYWRVCVFYRFYLAHNVIWFLMTGEWRKIDHRDGDGLNNRWANIRPATQAQNCQNKAHQSRNKTGYTGVHPLRDTGKFTAVICVNYKQFHLGVFDTPEEANTKRVEAKRKYHYFQPTERDR